MKPPQSDLTHVFRSSVEILHGIQDAGVDIFRFAFYPEGDKMKRFNVPSNPDYYLTRFSSQEAFENGSALSILKDFAGNVHPSDLDVVQRYIQNHLDAASSGLIPGKFTNFISERFRIRVSTHEPWSWYEIRSRLCSDDSELVLAEGVFTDVTKIILADLNDPLTALLSSTGMRLRLNDLLGSDAEQPIGIALVSLILNRFDEYEAGFGIQSANLVLISLSKQLSKSLPSGWFASHSRRGAFMLCANSPLGTFDQAEWRSSVLNLLPVVLSDLNTFLHALNGGSLLSSISVGISFFDPDQKQDADRLMQECTCSAYLASRSSSGAPYIYTSEIDTRIRDRSFLQGQLQISIDNGALKLLYQPQCNQYGEVVGAEALIRFPGLPGPNVLIPLAEETGQIVAIGDFVVKQCVRDMKVLKQHGLDKLGFNVSPAQFLSEELQRQFLTTLVSEIEAANLSIEDFEIEVTETAIFDAEGFAHKGFLRLSETGFSLALDDFGTGYSSLSFLRDFPVSKVKIDGSLVDNISDSPTDQVLVRGLAMICKSLGFQLVAERVETPSQVSVLNEIGVSIFQGYYFSPALSVTDLIAFVQSRSVQS